ncbi:LysR family transcriptional regulator [Frankia sp. CNm7]|uniref:LysR family transcriptional regulator n=1 Tax=Frankia nepalensis TaxID=1836974 RepID=A0A937ULJ2_9ACTN|nr:LysR substrate-binding domain-containing protein [Frankia nepalensis]MBL7500527.1 LysR family transcriptional regulator [Frankia nepalensis]MBL7509779.1 LysR family transcriptional regulator [Frankia nepalensis]MBL7521236.1 LysR family transcriptional regulator [Frankia nepalensis]MBL7627899.1 LysR family transcriptional regulator [Frankia nepalensis]
METKLELRHLVYFLALAEEQHFGRAAAKLFIGQPSLSQQLQRLERQLGVALFTRTSHEVRLTQAGQAFRVEAEQVLEHAQRAVETAREAAAGRLGTINIGFNFAAGQQVLRPTLRRLRADCPELSTTLWEGLSGQHLSSLSEGKIDVALVFSGVPPRPLLSQRVSTAALAAMVARHHPWAGRDQVSFRELVDQPIVLLRRERSPAMHDAVFAAAERCEVPLTVVAEVEDSGATAVMVETLQAVAFISDARPRRPTEDLVSVRVVDPVPQVGVWAVWRPDPRPAVGAFLNSLAAAAPFPSPPRDRAVRIPAQPTGDGPTEHDHQQ